MSAAKYAEIAGLAEEENGEVYRTYVVLSCRMFFRGRLTSLVVSHKVECRYTADALGARRRPGNYCCPHVQREQDKCVSNEYVQVYRCRFQVSTCLWASPRRSLFPADCDCCRAATGCMPPLLPSPDAAVVLTFSANPRSPGQGIHPESRPPTSKPMWTKVPRGLRVGMPVK